MFSSFDEAMNAFGRGAFAGADDVARRMVYQTVTGGAPTTNSTFLGERALDATNSNWYTSIALGTGASDWKKDSA